ncbi:hypothetical protein [Pseudanabaena sp. FACHB-2040]|uniref:hypothetical protein n=1 Tax=Pseudanabaena sp. FACHB-2040 TaxID=2692859 RepID=UPI0016893AAE|nr:hypothetical protein [Pseudanabaena sp. FACHB-2040]MBD2259538.1 hypothetical protein [Pseudanabaena sp. FACHB-2040]
MQIRSLPLQIATSLLVSFGLSFPAAYAQSTGLVELNDDNSTVRLNLDTLGVDAWIVDGVNQVFTPQTPVPVGPLGERYFLNFGTDPMSPEVGLGSFTLDSFTFSENALSAYLRGFDNALEFRYSLELQGGELNSGSSHRFETVTLKNLTDTAQQVSLFSYLDFDVAGTFGFDSVLIQKNSLQQVDVTGAKVTATVDQAADFVQVDLYPKLLQEFFNSSRTTLNNNSVLTSTDALTDVSAAFQFNRLLAPGGEVVFQFVKKAEKPGPAKDIPEPGSAIALGSAALAALLLKKYRLSQASRNSELN